MRYTSTVYYTSGGFKPKVLQKRFVKSASTKEKKKFKKE